MQDSRLTGGERPLRRRGKYTCLAFGLVVFALLNAAPTFASSAGLAGGGATLSYAAAAGETNNVVVGLSGTDFVITDSGVTSIIDAGGCTVSPGPPPQATCPAAGVTLVRVDLGDGSDSLAINHSTSALVLARDGVQDTVNCTGAGTVAADAADQVTGCQPDYPPDTTLVTAPPATTADSTPEFTFSSNEEPNVAFECKLDAGGFVACTSPFTPSAPLAEGPHSFEVRAIDQFGPDPSAAASGTFEVDTTPPETAINSGPPGESDATSASISFESPSADTAGFECQLDGQGWRTCATPATYNGLSVGTHVFGVRAVDDAGNRDPTEATVSFKVTSKPVAASGPPAGLIVVRPPASFVLIGGNTIRVSRKRVALVRLNCAGNRDCAGELRLTTAKRIRVAKRRGSRSRRRYVRLGAATFFIPAPRTVTVRIPLTKRAFRIVRKRKRIKTMITVTDKDRVGRTRISTREVFLRAK